jgi:glycosyltransferase involved in cell wall biosynthesis
MTKSNRDGETTSGVSVVITNYNKGRALARAVESIAKQTLPPLEVVLVDDCSDDADSLHTLDNLPAVQIPMRIYRGSYRRGASGAKNKGIRLASGDIIMLLDGDDCLPRKSVEEVWRVFREFPLVDFVFGDVLVTHGKEEKVITGDVHSDPKGFLDPRSLTKSWHLHGTTPFRVSLARQIGYFDELHPRTDDVDFFRRAIFSGGVGRYLPELIYEYHLDGAANSKNIDPLDLSFSWFRNIDFYWSILSRKEFALYFLRKSVLLCGRIMRDWFLSREPRR